ncbi:transposase [Streptomyces sp. NPDC056638]|uniref:transposase n=1 Tax=Streptomyces sp. NPDC056638 TaxID=3345887 RepID=UPI00369E04F2
MPVLPSWPTAPLWGQFAALLPERPMVDPAHPLRCHRRHISDRIVFDKLLQLLRFGCSYQAIADTTCSATTIRNRRDEWIRLGLFARLKQIALESYDRIVGLVLDQVAIDGSISHKGEKAPIQASQRWHIERTHARQNAFHRLARCYERRAMAIDAFFDLANAITIVRSLRRGAWTTHRWDNHPNRRP